MSRLIFITLMSLFIGSITLGLAGCATDGSYSQTERSADDILSSGILSSGCCG